METKTNPANYSPTSPLPPCKICGAKASGLHYGVNTCEACKGFFRRAIKFNKKYTCFREQNCDIIGGRSVRTSCPFCRLQKCLKMGMAHKAIKTGRYTHAKRTENIMEVKRLEKVKRGHRGEPWTNPPMDIVKQELADINSNSNNNSNVSNVSHPNAFTIDQQRQQQKQQQAIANTTSSSSQYNNTFPPTTPRNAFQAMHFTDAPSPHHPHHDHHDRDHHHHPHHANFNNSNNSKITPASSPHFEKQIINNNNNNLNDNGNNITTTNNINNTIDNNLFIHDNNNSLYQYCSDDDNIDNDNNNNNSSSSDTFPIEPDFPYSHHQLPFQTHHYNRNINVNPNSHQLFSHYLNPHQTTLTSSPTPRLDNNVSQPRDAQLEGVYISIPTPPLSSTSSLEDGGINSPHVMTSTTPQSIFLPETFQQINTDENKNIAFPFTTAIKEEIMDFPDNAFTTSNNNNKNSNNNNLTFTELLPSASSSSSSSYSSRYNTKISPPSSAFSFAEIKVENEDFDDNDFMTSGYGDTGMTYTQLLPPANYIPSGPTPSPSALSTSSYSSSSSSPMVFKLGGCEPLSGPNSPASSIPGLDLPAQANAISMSDREKQELMSNLLQSHRKFTITLAEYDSAFISTIQRQYIDKHRAKAEMFGLTSNFVQDEFYTEIFSQTGLDVDGRQEMRLLAARSVDIFLTSVINFAQSVPGFKTLCLGDQQKLVKVSVIEHWFVNAFLGINQRERVILMPNLKVFTFDEFASLLGEPFATKCFEMAPAFQNVSVSYEMLVLWKVILLFSPDRAELKDSKRVCQLQDVYLSLLLELIEKQRALSGNESAPNLFSQIINLTSLLRELDTVMPSVFDDNEATGIRAHNLLFRPPNS